MTFVRQHTLFLFPLTILLTLIGFIFHGCDETQVVDMMSDLTGAPDGMVLIPAGEVKLGVDLSTLIHDSTYALSIGAYKPQYTVFVDAFYIDTHEVTIDEWKAFVEATGYSHWVHPAQKAKYWISDNHPVSIVTFEDAKAYAEWVGKRLPTPEEWEKAARGGLVGMDYPWGNDPPTDDIVHVGKGSEALPMPVGSYPPNGYGLYDMGGNIAEMTTEYLTDCQPLKSNPDRLSCTAKSRGGSFMFGSPTVWSNDIFRTDLDRGRYYHIGFRLVADVK